MSSRIDSTQLRVSLRWLPSRRFFFSATNAAGYAIKADHLANILLAWDEDSFYGTLPTLEVVDGQEGFTLSAARAVQFFTKCFWNTAIPVSFPDEFAQLCAVAERIDNALTKAQFRPDFASWRQGKRGWCIENWNVPTAQEVQEAQDITISEDGRDSALEDAREATPEGVREIHPVGFGEHALPYAAEWLSQAVQDSIERSPELADAWSALLATYPLLQPQSLHGATDVTTSYGEEADWLADIGLGGEPLPFVMGLRLSEPIHVDEEIRMADTENGTPESWRLQVIVQDRQDPSHVVPLNRIMSTAREQAASAYPVEYAYKTRLLSQVENSDYQAMAQVKVDRGIARILHLAPWLAAAEDSMVLRQQLSTEEAWQFLSAASVRIAEAGFTVLLPPWWEAVRKSEARLKAAVRSAPKAGSANKTGLGLAQLLEFDWRISIGNEELTEAEFRELLTKQGRLVQVRGQWMQIDPEFYVRALAAMERFGKRRGLSLQDVLSRYLLGTGGTDAVSDDPKTDEVSADHLATLGSADEFAVVLDRSSTKWLSELQQPANGKLDRLPDSFSGTLRPYQMRGVAWLLFLRQYGLGACLADDMGLGKTVQFIAYLASVWEEGRSGVPTLLVCPMSVVGNWQKEWQKFAPAARIYVHHGTRRAKGDALAAAVADVDVVLTTYSLVHLDQEDLSAIDWDVVCLDEAQNIKNPHTKQAVAIRSLQGIHRIAMTGTPIENRLSELWSIYQFMNPGFLGSLRNFTDRFVTPVEKSGDTSPLDGLRRLTQPFLLRRSKRDPAIELDLPEKAEMKVFVQLTAEQAALYERVLEEMLEKLDTLPPMERRGVIVATLTKLKQVCDHPDLYYKEETKGADWVQRSVKVERLVDMVGELRSEGDRCLIFTQFVGMGERLQAILKDELGEEVLFLHGSLSKAKRDEMIEQFQAGREDDAGPGILLLSLKAGGVGLNLTAANHVFHFDRWWNPAVEQQATDRAFRIGQTRRVQVHKFVALGTLEERIDEMIERKQALGEQVIGGGEQWISELSTGELRDLFSLRREWVE